MLSCWHVTSPVVNSCLLQSCPGAALSMPSGADPVNRAISDLIFIMQEALTPQHLPTLGSAVVRAKDWQAPYGLQPSADSRQTDLAAGRFLNLIQGYIGMREDAAQDGSGVDLGISHLPAFSITVPISVTNR